MRLSSISAAVFCAVVVLFPAACDMQRAKKVSPERAAVRLYPTEGHRAEGTVLFEKTPEGVAVSVFVRNLKPGKHGFHIHEYGDCCTPDGSAAGGHFNPDGAQHGGRLAVRRHVGDLGNIEADSAGIVRTEFTDTRLRLDGPYSIIGRGVIVHQEADDLLSQPSGDAGARVACGVIGIAK